MSLVDHSQDIVLDYPWESVFNAIETAIPKLKGMQISNVNKITKTISAKAGVSLFSWGENITITLIPIEDNKTKVSILSTPKTGIMFGGAMDMGKNLKNINTIINEATKYL